MNDLFGVWAADGPRTVAIHADLRLDNRNELVAGLSLPSTVTDADLLRSAWARWGDELGRHLLGDFAFALVDLAEKELVIVRDAFGVKPLYFAQQGEKIAFASHVRTLLERAHIEVRPDEAAIVDYIGGFPRDEERTAIAAIRRIPPAHCFRFARGRLRRYEWWRADAVPETRLPTREHTVAFRAELERAVESRLPERGRVGVLLSGGLDSSSIACIAARAIARRGETLEAFSAVFANGEADERSFQRSVVSSTRAHAVDVDVGRSAPGELGSVLHRFGEPTLVGGHWLVEPLLDEAKARGVTVLLTGVDGDRVVSHGRGWLEELAARGDYLALRAEVKARGLTGLGAGRAILTKALAGVAPLVTNAVVRARRRWVDRRKLEMKVFSRDVLSRTRSFERWLDDERVPRSAREHHVRALGRSDRASDVEVFPPLLDKTLDVRHPFYDRRLVELCVSLPGNQKLHAGQSRFVLREAMRGIVPETVRARPTKAYFDAPFASWAAKAIAENTNDFTILSPYLDPSKVPSLPMDAVWRCMVVSAWLRGIES